MREQGRLQQFRHAFPELFTPGIHARRGGLRLRWFALQLVDSRPLWTVSAAAGLSGLLLSIALFFLPGASVTSEAQAAVSLPLPAPTEEAPPSETLRPVVPPSAPEPELTFTEPLPQPRLQAGWSRLSLPWGWDDRPLATVRSRPQPRRSQSIFPAPLNDGWARSIARMVAVPSGHVPYREPEGLRDWEPVTPKVIVSDSVSSSPGLRTAQTPSVRIEKHQPAAVSPDRPLRYEIVVINPGEQPVAEVTVFESIDVQRVTHTEPPARVEPTGLEWRLGGLAPGEHRRLAVHVAPRGLEELSTVTEVELGERLAAVALVETETPFYPEPQPQELPPQQETPFFPLPSELPPFPSLDGFPPAQDVPSPSPTVNQPAPIPMDTTEAQPAPQPILKLTVLPPSEAAVGKDAITWYEISNVGDGAAENVELSVSLPPGLTHHDGQRQVKHTIGRLRPGETRRARLVTRVETPGVFQLAGQLSGAGRVETNRTELMALESAPPWPGSSMKLPAAPQEILPSHYTVESPWEPASLDGAVK